MGSGPWWRSPPITIRKFALPVPFVRFLALPLLFALVGGIKRDRILNFMTRDELLAWVAAVPNTAAGRFALSFVC